MSVDTMMETFHILLMTVFGVFLTFFSGHHIRLTLANVTTLESFTLRKSVKNFFGGGRRIIPGKEKYIYLSKFWCRVVLESTRPMVSFDEEREVFFGSFLPFTFCSKHYCVFLCVFFFLQTRWNPPFSQESLVFN